MRVAALIIVLISGATAYWMLSGEDAAPVEAPLPAVDQVKVPAVQLTKFVRPDQPPAREQSLLLSPSVIPKVVTCDVRVHVDDAAGKRVTLMQRSGDSAASVLLNVMGDGFVSLKPGRWFVADRPTEPREVDVTCERVDYHFRLLPIPVIRGVVVSDRDEPAVGATVHVGIVPVQTDVFGRFEVVAHGGLPTTVRATLGDASSREFTVSDASAEVKLKLAPTYPLSLVVEVGAEVLVKTSNGAEQMLCGSVCTLMVPSGPFSVLAHVGGRYAIRTETMPMRAFRLELEFKPIEPQVGIVRAEGNRQGLAGVRVVAQKFMQPELGGQVVTTKRAGYFEFMPHAFTTELTIDGLWRPTRRVLVTLGDGPVVIDVVPLETATK